MSAGPAKPLPAAHAGDADALYDRLAALVRDGEEAQALPLARDGVARHKLDARLWQMLGLACRKLDRLEEACTAFARAAELRPADPLIAHSLARCRLEAGVPAAEPFERAHRLAPRDGSVLLGRAAAWLAEGCAARAVAGLEEQLRLHPGWQEGHATVARLLWMQGESEGFTRSYEAALQRAPRDPELWAALIETLLDAGLHDRALGAIARAGAATGQPSGFIALEAAARTEAGDAAGADPLFARLQPIAHLGLALRYLRHLLRAGRIAEASAFADAWRPRDPDGLLTPYSAAIWRLTGDPRWQWLEGDGRLVGVYDLADCLPPLDGLAERLRSLHLAVHQPLEQSVRGGTQTDGPLFSRIEPEIRALRAAIVAAVDAHVAQLPPPDPAHPTLGAARQRPVRFAGSWSVRLQGGGRHANHVHPQGWLSSALYVALPPEADRGPAPAGWLTLGEPQAELGLALEPFRRIEPRPGRLVLFPSTMWHGTVPFGAGERLTVAFDVARPRPAAG